MKPLNRSSKAANGHAEKDALLSESYSPTKKNGGMADLLGRVLLTSIVGLGVIVGSWIYFFPDHYSQTLETVMRNAGVPSSPESYLNCTFASAHGANDNLTSFDLNCKRSPPCVHAGYFYAHHSFKHCEDWDEDQYWPTWEPYLERTAETKNMKHMAQLMQNKTMLFIGDSVTYQTYYSAMCSLARHKAMGSDPREISLKKKLFRYGAKWVLVYAAPEYSALFIFARINNYEREMFQKYFDAADVVLANIGLHYREPEYEAYKEHVEGLAKHLSEFNRLPGKYGVMRESTAQHFPNSGEWNSSDPSHRHSCQCQEMNENVIKNNIVARQNRYMNEMGDKYKVPVVPFYDITAQRHDMHIELCAPTSATLLKGESGCCDCTHYCYTPVLWDFFVTNVYNALRRIMPESS